jgi:predicted HTH domain antitoxin
MLRLHLPSMGQGACVSASAVVHWYSRGLISQERAAQVAGLDRTDFILALASEGVDAFAVDMNSLRGELADA